MSQSSPFSDPPLPFPIKVVPSRTGPVQIYEIPDDRKEEVLEQLYIFRPIPSLDDVMEDIHTGKRFRVRAPHPLDSFSPPYLAAQGPCGTCGIVRRCSGRTSRSVPSRPA
jgi:hypothetical protein